MIDVVLVLEIKGGIDRNLIHLLLERQPCAWIDDIVQYSSFTVWFPGL